MHHTQTLSNHDLLSVIVGKAAAKQLCRRPLAEIFGLTKPKAQALPLGIEEEPAAYGAPITLQAARELYTRALAEQMRQAPIFGNPAAVKEYLIGKLAGLDSEVFAVLFLDQRHALIAYEELFQGTIDSCSIYPREIAKRALEHNAAAVILAHNHPSGNPEPSKADETITRKVKDALLMLDIRTLDHIVIGANQSCSMAERGLV
ncbi:DNA repair protein RadC [Acidithiobacillus caldus]|jgi:DNA repair protein RadC|nr:DNA repair protein RadC [Acidithiobacillus caldus]MBU2820930.1 DNA repair protein RadC [Acidithiobacillus caldus]